MVKMDRYKIGIVGGSGFVGSSLAMRLSDSFKIKVFDKRPVPNDIKNKVDFQYCDVRDYNEVKDKIKDVDLIIYTAIVEIPLINEEKRLGYEVNVLGIQNVCEVAKENESIKGLLLTSTAHVFGDMGFQGVADEEFGFKFDIKEDRAKYYTLTKIAQETIVRIFDAMSGKIYGAIRMGTVLGEKMPEKTAANIFITKGLRGEAITPYKHSMHRQMFYVDINDICEAFQSFAFKILNNEVEKRGDSSAHVFNLAYPHPVTILELATIVRDAIVKQTKNEIRPEIKIIDEGLPSLHKVGSKEDTTVDMEKVKSFLGLKKITSPKEAIERIVMHAVLKSSR